MKHFEHCLYIALSDRSEARNRHFGALSTSGRDARNVNCGAWLVTTFVVAKRSEVQPRQKVENKARATSTRHVFAFAHTTFTAARRRHELLSLGLGTPATFARNDYERVRRAHVP